MSDLITLVLKDNEKIKFPSGISQMSELIKGIVEESGSSEEIPIEQINKPILELIKVYAEHHSYKNPLMIPSPLNQTSIEIIHDQWNTSFLKGIPEGSLKDLLHASEYLQMKSLQNLLLAYIAFQIKDRSIEDLRNEYAIEDHYTEEIEDQLIQDNPWIFTIFKSN